MGSWPTYPGLPRRSSVLHRNRRPHQILLALCIFSLLLFGIPLAAPALGDVVHAATPALTVSSSSLVPGQSFTVSGSNFQANEIVIFTWDGTLLSNQASADGTGAFSNAAQSVPQSASTGTHQLTARGTSSATTASLTITVPAAAAAVTPSSGPPGTTVSVSGSGFGASEPVTISYGGTSLVAVGASATGVVNPVSFNVPNPAAAGAASIVLQGVNTGRSATIPFTVTTQPVITLTPTVGAPSAVVTVNGSGFGPTEPLTVSFDGVQIVTGTSTAAGIIAGLTFPVPNPVATGAHVVLVRGTASGLMASQPFTASVQTSIGLSPSAAIPGATVSVNGSGFGATEPLTVSLDGTQVATTTTTASGTFTGTSFMVPTSVTTGTHTVLVRGNTTGVAQSALLAVNTTATIVLSATSGLPGSNIVVSGAGFGAGEQVTLQFDSAVAVTTTASATGSFAGLSLMIPSGATAGQHTLTAHGQQSGQSASASVTVLAPATLTLSPNTGAVATIASAAMQGFAAGEMVTLSVGGATLASTQADNNGNISNLLFVVPALPGGAQTITAHGATSGRTATATFTIATALSSNTASVDAGATIQMTGTGYLAGEQVQILLNSNVIDTPTTDATGAFRNAAVAIPANVVPGAYLVTARGLSSGRTATVSLVVVSPAHLNSPAHQR